MNTLMMPAAAARFNHVIAFDVAKASLSLHILPSGETLSLQNDGAAIRRLLKREEKRNRKQGLGRMVCLPEFDLQPRRGSLPAESFLNVGKRAGAVNLRLSFANEIQVRAIENKNWLHWFECGDLPLETETPPAFTEAEVCLLEYCSAYCLTARHAKRAVALCYQLL